MAKKQTLQETAVFWFGYGVFVTFALVLILALDRFAMVLKEVW